MLNARYHHDQKPNKNQSTTPNGNHIYLGPPAAMEDNDIFLVLISLAGIGFKDHVVNTEHVWAGAPGSRKISQKSIVELSSRSVRETCLAKSNEGSSNLNSQFPSKK